MRANEGNFIIGDRNSDLSTLLDRAHYSFEQKNCIIADLVRFTQAFYRYLRKIPYKKYEDTTD